MLLRRDNLAKTRWRFKQNHLPEKVCPALVMVIHELETVQGMSFVSTAVYCEKRGVVFRHLETSVSICDFEHNTRVVCTFSSSWPCSGRPTHPVKRSALSPGWRRHHRNLTRSVYQAGISKFACVGYGWGADPLWPLAQSGAVDAWAIVHGHINRGFIRQVKTPGIVLVSYEEYTHDQVLLMNAINSFFCWFSMVEDASHR